MESITILPAGHSLESLNHLNNSLLTISSHGLPIVLCGDFNVPHIDWATVSPDSSTGPADHLCTIVLDTSLIQHVVSPTRESNILDLVLANCDCISSVGVIDNLSSTDHSAVEFHLSVSIPIQRQCQ